MSAILTCVCSAGWSADVLVNWYACTCFSHLCVATFIWSLWLYKAVSLCGYSALLVHCYEHTSEFFVSSKGHGLHCNEYRLLLCVASEPSVWLFILPVSGLTWWGGYMPSTYMCDSNDMVAPNNTHCCCMVTCVFAIPYKYTPLHTHFNRSSWGRCLHLPVGEVCVCVCLIRPSTFLLGWAFLC